MERVECEVGYWGHSGFSVRTPGRLLAFDLVGGAMPPPAPADRALIFISHAHGDHFDPRALGLGAARFGGFDLPESAACLRMRPGEEALWDGARVRAFPSTDEGVSFWVEADGARVFHAGDLNFWHWRAQSSPEEVREAEDAFEAALAQLAGLPMDIAFFPVDARLGEGHDEGALRFARAVRPRLLLPMHFWDREGVARAFPARQMPAGVAAKALTRPGERARVSLPREGPALLID